MLLEESRGIDEKERCNRTAASLALADQAQDHDLKMVGSLHEITRRLVQHHSWKKVGSPRREQILEDPPQLETNPKTGMHAISQLHTYRKPPLAH